MNIHTMDVLSDWDDWSEDASTGWLDHPLHRPRIHQETPRKTVLRGHLERQKQLEKQLNR
jgi:hypothetical protein